MKRLALIWLAFLLLVTGPVQAGERLIVVELFTAQGCPACPPADKVLADLAERDYVLALTWSVDYWDYSGWKDTFADPAHTERQELYNASMGFNSVYTPQMIINGRHQTVGSRPEEVQDLLVENFRDIWLPVSIAESAGGVNVSIEAGDTEQSAAVTLVWFDSERQVDVMYGDNRGRRLQYANVVRGMKQIGEWTGERLEIPIDLKDVNDAGSNWIAILVQSAEGGPVLGAAKFVLAPRPRG